MMKVAIAGTVGVGKSTVVKHFEDKGVKVYYESIDNNILDLFHKSKITGENEEKIKCLNQFNFLLDNIKRDIYSECVDQGLVVYDRSIAEHIHAFVKLNLDDAKFSLYDNIQKVSCKMMNFCQYDVTILLRAKDETITKRIAKRSRSLEADTSLVDYHLRLNKLYNSVDMEMVLNKYSKDNVVVVYTDDLAPEEVCKICEMIIDTTQSREYTYDI
jgi:deoxyadenosine/deoxycytidine kinase